MSLVLCFFFIDVVTIVPISSQGFVTCSIEGQFWIFVVAAMQAFQEITFRQTCDRRDKFMARYIPIPTDLGASRTLHVYAHYTLCVVGLDYVYATLYT